MRTTDVRVALVTAVPLAQLIGILLIGSILRILLTDRRSPRRTPDSPSPPPLNPPSREERHDCSTPAPAASVLHADPAAAAGRGAPGGVSQRRGACLADVRTPGPRGGEPGADAGP